jgi:WD40 repeat protein
VFSPDGKRLATSSVTFDPAGGRVDFQTWDAATGAPVGKKTMAKDSILVLNFDRRSRRLLAGDSQHQLQVRDPGNGEALPSLSLTSCACSLDSSPAEGRIAVGADNGTVSIWDVERGRSLDPLLFHYARVESVQFDQTGNRLLTASGDGTVKLWKLTRAEPARTTLLEGEWPKTIDPGSIRPSFGREAGPIQIPLMDGTVRLIDLDRLREVHRLVPSRTNEPPYLAESAPDGRHWVVYGRKVLDLFSLDAGGSIRRCSLGPSDAAFKFSPDSRRMLTIDADRVFRLWSTADGRVERTTRLREPFVGVVCLGIDLQSALVAQDNSIHQWFDLATGTSLGSPFHLPSVWTAQLDPSGQRIAIVGRDQSVRVWNTRTAEPASPIFKHAGSAIFLDWSPDGRQLVTAGLSADARIWDATAGEQLLSPLSLSSEPIHAARWSPDGRFIVARSDDQLVRVWDATTAEPITPKLRQQGYVRFACLRTNNDLLIATDPNFMQVWKLAETLLAPDVIADYARLLSGRHLNPNGTLLPLKPEELAALRRSLATRAPELFR